MPRKKILLISNQIYHVVLRGIDGRLLFEDDRDYYRAIHDLFEFNDIQPAPWHHRQFFKHYGVRPRSDPLALSQKTKRQPRVLLVRVLAFCLMPNHIHLLLEQLRDKGISDFVKKLGGGYATYFNAKYKRQGHLFQGRFKAVHIQTQAQLQTVFVYVHTNPAALVDSNWKEGGVENPSEVIEFIENYKWSSYSDYLGKENFPSVTQRELFNQTMPRDKWRAYVNDWVKHKAERAWDKAVELE
jgi:putative transposase